MTGHAFSPRPERRKPPFRAPHEAREGHVALIKGEPAPRHEPVPLRQGKGVAPHTLPGRSARRTTAHSSEAGALPRNILLKGMAGTEDFAPLSCPSSMAGISILISS